jgi:hypothetical protein
MVFVATFDNYKVRFEFLFYTHLLANFGANTRLKLKKIIFSMHIYKKCGFSLVIASENTQYHLEHPFYMNFSYNNYFGLMPRKSGNTAVPDVVMEVI